MKTNTVLISSAAAFFASAGVAFSFYQADNDGLEHYSPYKPVEASEVVEVEEEEKKGPKGASRYMHMLKANPSTGTYSSTDIRKATQQASNNQTRAKADAGAIQWESRGPDNFGGRTRAIVVSNQDNSTIYAGGASGGLYKSTNKGSTWDVVPYQSSDETQYSSLAISCMEQASDGTLYFGTGEVAFATYSGLETGNAKSGGYRGMGIWKSSDGGETWDHLESTIPNQPFGGSSARSNTWSGVNELAIDPNNPEHVYAATMLGLQVSTDGGKTWNSVSSLPPASFLEVEISPNGETIFTGSNTKLYKAKLGGSPGALNFNITPRSAGFPQNGIGRIEVGIAPSNQDVVYANVTGNNGRMIGIYRSSDNGENWKSIAEGGGLFDPFALSVQGQGTWGNLLKVSPYDENRIFVGGVELWTYKGNGNANGDWKKIANSNRFIGDQGNPRYVHVDNHEIRFDTESNPPVMYIGNDGGVFKTSNDFRKNLSPNYKVINTGYITSQFYAFDVSPDGEILGGTQDNGTWKYQKNGLTKKSFSKTPVGGDGFYSVISELRPNVHVSESQYSRIYRTSDGGESYNGDLFDENVGLPDDYGSFRPRQDDRVVFNTPFALYENKNDTLSRDSVEYEVGNEVVFEAGKTRNVPQDSVEIYKKDGDFTQVRGNVFQAKRDLNRLPGGEFTITSKDGIDFTVAVDSALAPQEKVVVQDPVTALFAIAFGGRTGGEVYITPDMLNFSESPTWYRVATPGIRTPTTVRFSEDGKSLLVGGAGGSGGRVTRIDSIRSTEYSYRGISDPTNFVSQRNVDPKNIAGFNTVVTSATFDKNDKNRIVVTTGNYGPLNHIYYATNGMSDNPDFNPLDNQGSNPFPDMPAYDALFQEDSSTQIVVGSEMGTWYYDLAEPTAGWRETNNGMPRVPTLMLRQQVVNGEYRIYAGTFGRGIFASGGQSVGVDDNTISNNQDYEPSLRAYPNPARTYTNLEADLEEGKRGQLQMVNMQGQIVKQEILKGSPDKQTVRLRTGNLKPGTYIIRLTGDNANQTTKVVVE